MASTYAENGLGDTFKLLGAVRGADFFMRVGTVFAARLCYGWLVCLSRSLDLGKGVWVTHTHLAADRPAFLWAPRKGTVATICKNARQCRPVIFAANARCVVAKWSGERMRHMPLERLTH